VRPSVPDGARVQVRPGPALIRGRNSGANRRAEFPVAFGHGHPLVYIKHFEKISFARLEWVDIRKLLALHVHRTC